jgi:hypothetical protein
MTTKQRRMYIVVLFVVCLLALASIACNDSYCERSCKAKAEACKRPHGADEMMCNVQLDVCMSRCNENPCN